MGWMPFALPSLRHQFRHYSFSATPLRALALLWFLQLFSFQLVASPPGRVVAWGENSAGAVTVPADAKSGVVAVAAGYYHSLALKHDGTVLSWGWNGYGQTSVPAGLNDVIAIAAGLYHSVALKRNGTVVCWGAGSTSSDPISWTDERGQSVTPAGLSNVVAISAGGYHTVALKQDGSVVSWGEEIAGQPENLVDVVAVSAGLHFTVALRQGGTVEAWGYNGYGQTDVPSDLAGIVAVSAGFYQVLALKGNGTLVKWGGQPEPNAPLNRIASMASARSHAIALTDAGVAISWGGGPEITTVPAGLRPLLSVAAGGFHTLAVEYLPSIEEAATKVPFDPATVANWQSAGAQWVLDEQIFHDGLDSVKAQTTDDQSTYREYTVAGPAVVDFWWKVSSEQIYDKFTYSLNSVDQEAISGEVDWTYRTLTLPAGTHTIRWTYSKDAADAVGQDAGWLDDFAVYPATPTLRVRDGSTVLDGTQTVDFGDADLGTAGFTKSLALANEGYVPLEVELSLPEGSSFSFEDGSSVYSLLLGRGENINVPINLSTQSSGIKAAVLTINAPDSTVAPPQITLTGEVPGPVVGVSLGGATLTSGQTVDMGLAPKTLEFTIRNDGNIGDLLPQLSVTGNFRIVQQPAASVAPQGSTTFKVLAQSGAFGQQTGGITILSNDGITPAFSLVLNSSVFFSTANGFANEDTATFGTGGAAGWNFASTQLPGGSTGQAIKTGATPNSGSSVLEMVTQSAGVVSWSWRASAQENFDWLLCEVNGQEVAGISTKSGAWQTQVVQVPAGANVRWVYSKDASASAGEDAGYLADVEFRSFAANQSFSQWGQPHGIPISLFDKATPKLMKACFGWLGGYDPAVGLDAGHHVPIMEGGRLKYRFAMSKTADGWQQILYSPDMSAWTTRRFSQRIVSEDADRVVLEATAPSGTKGFFKVVGGGDTNMVWVQGGSLPQTSELAGTAVSTFLIGQYEVTWDEWQYVRAWAVNNGYTDLAGVGAGAGSYPVQSVNWYDVVKWCNAKSEMTGRTPVYKVGGAVYRSGEFGWTGSTVVTQTPGANGYRLPTEAEWEWAARGGVKSQGYNFSGSNDVNAVAWYALVFNRGVGPWPVGQKGANELGLHDMSGNAWELCEDLYDSNNWHARRIRGGGWTDSADYATVAYRNVVARPPQRHESYGFRIARSSGL
jgi:formylglycine-generating enzyme required for sulfatase activity